MISTSVDLPNWQSGAGQPCEACLNGSISHSTNRFAPHISRLSNACVTPVFLYWPHPLTEAKAYSVDKGRSHERTHLFTVRLWAESLGDNHFEWRGQARHVLSGRVCTFREWPSLVAFLQAAALAQSRRDDSRDQPQELP
jgi:hypothetical protein